MATLTVPLPEKIGMGALLEYKSVTQDDSQFRTFDDEFRVRVIAEIKEQQTLPGHPREPPSSKDGNERKINSGLSLPNIAEIHRSEWDDHQFNEQSALKVKDAGEQGYDFYVNMDNIHLLTEAKIKSDIDAKLLQGRFKYALVLIGLALLKSKNASDDDSPNGNIYEKISETTMRLSPIILPMISYLGELTLED